MSTNTTHANSIGPGPLPVPLVPLPLASAQWLIDKHIALVPPEWRPAFYAHYRNGGASPDYNVYDAYNCGAPIPPTNQNQNPSAGNSSSANPVPPSPPAKPSKRGISDALSPEAEDRCKRRKKEDADLLSLLDTDVVMRDNDLVKRVEAATIESKNVQKEAWEENELTKQTQQEISKLETEACKVDERSEAQIAEFKADQAQKVSVSYYICTM